MTGDLKKVTSVLISRGTVSSLVLWASGQEIKEGLNLMGILEKCAISYFAEGSKMTTAGPMPGPLFNNDYNRIE